MLHNGQPAGVLLAVKCQFFAIKLQEETKQQRIEATMDMTIWCLIIFENVKVYISGPQEEKL